MSRALFLTHAEVEIDTSVPVPDWGLNAQGHARHARFAQDSELDCVRSIYASTERKARDAAVLVAEARGLDVETHPDLGENDRSATGYLPPQEFWSVVDQFFAAPDDSVRGWETARAAQGRIVRAAKAVLDAAPGGDVLIIAHGAVGTLLCCALRGVEITRSEGQPHPGGGCWFAFNRAQSSAPTEWRAI